MIGNPKWFSRRKYSGWGVNPKTWQGWVYIAAVLGSFAVFQAFPWSTEIRVAGTVVWAAFLAADLTDVMRKMKKDEREVLHEAFAERNAMWATIIVLSVGIVYQVVTSAFRGIPEVDPVIIAAIFVALVVKAASNIYMDRKD